MQRSGFKHAAVALLTCASGLMANTSAIAADLASAPASAARPQEAALISFDLLDTSKINTSGCSSLMAMRSPFSTFARTETDSCKRSAKWRLANQVTDALMNRNTTDTQVVSFGLRPDLQNLVVPCRERIKNVNDKSAAVKGMSSCLAHK